MGLGLGVRADAAAEARVERRRQGCNNENTKREWGRNGIERRRTHADRQAGNDGGTDRGMAAVRPGAAAGAVVMAHEQTA